MFGTYNVSRKYEMDRPQISEKFATQMTLQNMQRRKLNENNDISSDLVTEALVSIINHKGANFLEMTGEELVAAINGFADYRSKKSA